MRIIKSERVRGLCCCGKSAEFYRAEISPRGQVSIREWVCEDHKDPAQPVTTAAEFRKTLDPYMNWGYANLP